VIAGADLGVTLYALDSCDEIDPTFTGTVSVQFEQIDGTTAPGRQVTFAAADGGRLETSVSVPSPG
jgi:hypothetical protein